MRGTMKIGILPLFSKGFINNGAWCKSFLETVDGIGVESVWTVEHPIVAENYEHLYSLSAIWHRAVPGAWSIR